MENLGPQPPIVIRRGGRVRHEDHGGAWKVAMADFALALMALFLVLWIINNSTEDERKAISGYFQDPRAFEDGRLAPSATPIDLGGSPSIQANVGQDGASDPMVDLQANPRSSDGEDQDQLEHLEQMLEELIIASPTLSPFKNQIMLDMTTEGLRLQIVDRRERPMFETGSARLTYYTEDILWELAPTLAQSSLSISVTGHTDAMPNNPTGLAEDNGNWLLSAARADAARFALVEAGVANQQIARVVGMGDTAPYNPDDPTAAVNRRIGLLLLRPKAEKREQELDYFEQQQDEDRRAQQTENAAGRADSDVGRVQQNRDRPDNQYDNPPNLYE